MQKLVPASSTMWHLSLAQNPKWFPNYNQVMTEWVCAFFFVAHCTLGGIWPFPARMTLARHWERNVLSRSHFFPIKKDDCFSSRLIYSMFHAFLKLTASPQRLSYQMSWPWRLWGQIEWTPPRRIRYVCIRYIGESNYSSTCPGRQRLWITADFTVITVGDSRVTRPTSAAGRWLVTHAEDSCFGKMKIRSDGHST
jgi:hypothetical protein